MYEAVYQQLDAANAKITATVPRGAEQELVELLTGRVRLTVTVTKKRWFHRDVITAAGPSDAVRSAQAELTEWFQLYEENRAW